MPSKSHKTFRPLLCRLSKTDTVQPIKLPGPSTDPSSPKLTCIGQMKKKSTSTTNHHFLTGNLTDPINSRPSVHSKRYLLFSGKNLISPAIETATTIKQSNSKCVTATNRSKSCKGRGRTPIIRSNRYYTNSSDDHDIMRVVVDEILDPPLPVVKCGRRGQEVSVNLCKRRGIEMKMLQIQQVNQNINVNNG
ncbi:uncharacterized protein LOC143579185 [Bidens hawaiensis]|uniref:uncharacterized protein LOC143579185 n=1 Tax=Bidens hawaiensis TaxID=980011 RepID=UPI00404A9145